MSRAHLTAISRKTPSAPLKHLLANDLIKGRVLDYGCGRGADADAVGADKYDPHYAPVVPTGTFDTVTCTYVLNVVPDKNERDDIVASLRGLLAPNGTAFISVRNDSANLNGWTSKGTWQGLVELGLPIVTKNSSFTTYQLKGTK